MMLQLASANLLCLTNSDCKESTYCCMTGTCQHPSMCLNGLKQTGDSCDNNYECSSRCCDEQSHPATCNFFRKCIQ